MLRLMVGIPGEETYSPSEASRILSRGGRSLTERRIRQMLQAGELEVGLLPIGNSSAAGVSGKCSRPGSWRARVGDNQHGGTATVAVPKTTADVAKEAGMSERSWSGSAGA